MFITDPKKNVNINLSVASEIITHVSSYTIITVSGNKYEIKDINSINKIKNFLNNNCNTLSKCQHVFTNGVKCDFCDEVKPEEMFHCDCVNSI